MSVPRRAGVLGHPIEHSLSPALHAAAYQALGLAWEYERYDVEVGGLAEFIAGCGPEWAGLSLTMPLKSAVLELADEVSDLAAATSSANTVVFRDGRVTVDNTDVPGMVSAIGADLAPGSATILGGGATARSALAAVARLGARDVAVFVRRPEAGRTMLPLADSVGVSLSVEPWERAAEGLLADVTISTVPAGIPDLLADAVPWSPGALLDVVYAGWPTALAAAWADRGGQVASGLDLLVEQAALQVALMTGQEPPIEVMRRAGEQAAGHPGN